MRYEQEEVSAPCPCGAGKATWVMHSPDYGYGRFWRDRFALRCDICASQWELRGEVFCHTERLARLSAIPYEPVTEAQVALRQFEAQVAQAKMDRALAYFRSAGVADTKKAQLAALQKRGHAVGLSYSAFCKDPLRGFERLPETDAEVEGRRVRKAAFDQARERCAELRAAAVGGLPVYFDPTRGPL